MIFHRTIESRLLKAIHHGPDKGVILYGPRQAGKTTLLKKIMKECSTPALWFTGDDIRTQELFGVPRLDILKRTVGDAALIVIDEAQMIPNIGLSSKLLIDEINIRLVLSGSSSFDLADRVNEPLTGRVTFFHLYPLSHQEIPKNALDRDEDIIEIFLRYGMYPACINRSSEQQKAQYITDLINTYLYKDMLMIEGIRKPKKLLDLLSLLALQIGSEVSIAELCTRLALSRPIVEKYLDILEKMFVIINVRGLSRNMRKEIYKTSKYYFVDLGLRNGLINNHNPMPLRTDAGALFENYCAIERIKLHRNAGILVQYYFWRTWDQKELDWVEDRGGALSAYEWKWSETSPLRASTREAFLAAYPNSAITCITPKTLSQLYQ